MHFQIAPHAETKVVRCVKGAVLDVIIELRANSPALRSWRSFEFTAENGPQLYIRQGFAHGFQTLTETVEVSYLISEFFTPRAAAGVSFDDPAFGIRWHPPTAATSDKDKTSPDFLG